MSERLTAIRPAILLVAAFVLAACQGSIDAATAERARPAEIPSAVPEAFDHDACWTQTRVIMPNGAEEDRLLAVPCPGATDAYFRMTLQRALAVRGLYAGPINGIDDDATRDAVRRYQAPLGLDSPVLSLVAARGLGLLPWPVDLS